MKKEIRDFADVMREEDEAAMARTKAEIAKEDAAWNALTLDQKDAVTAAKEAKQEAEETRQARIAADYEAEYGPSDPDDDEDEEEDEDEDED